jgi:hypothetical protein
LKVFAVEDSTVEPASRTSTRCRERQPFFIFPAPLQVVGRDRHVALPLQPCRDGTGEQRLAVIDVIFS